jgi:light-regulated signal transduction histidine kinase (bacteriophytochrome)
MTFVPLGKDRIIAASIDITERKRMEFDLRRSNAELQQFANVASHDLQEPLRMVIGYLSLLQKRYDDKLDDEAKGYIDVAVNGGKRMKMLIDDLLAYSRVDVQDKDFTPVDMNQVVKRVLEVLREAVEENKAEIELDPLPTVIAEESQMAQVIQNLVSNAIKFRGKESPRIRITATAGSGEWIFSVSDNGIGLSMEYADRIFQMFQRLHTRDEYPGTGVGLAIVKKIVERHGGRICVESEVGKGATFIFTIPVRS